MYVQRNECGLTSALGCVYIFYGEAHPAHKGGKRKELPVDKIILKVRRRFFCSWKADK